MEIYQPSDDSYFFADFLKKYFTNQLSPLPYLPSVSLSKMTMLDMGSGSGILAETASEFIDKKNILTSDINLVSVKLLRQKGFKSIKSNLFKNIDGKFDVITFNVPYLLKDKREPKSSQVATTGGKHGDEISIKFLRQAKKHLNKNGKIFLLISSITPINKIKKFNPKIIARKKLFMEELLILHFQN